MFCTCYSGREQVAGVAGVRGLVVVAWPEVADNLDDRDDVQLQDDAVLQTATKVLKGGNRMTINLCLTRIHAAANDAVFR